MHIVGGATPAAEQRSLVTATRCDSSAGASGLRGRRPSGRRDIILDGAEAAAGTTGRNCKILRSGRCTAVASRGPRRYSPEWALESHIYGIGLSGATQTICDSGDGWEGGVIRLDLMIDLIPSVADKVEDQDLRRSSWPLDSDVR
jgi:hypothetical protein